MVEINISQSKAEIKVTGRTKNQVNVRIKVSTKLSPGFKVMTVHGLSEANAKAQLSNQLKG
jgi:hypothetical protein